jgi:hypothetical protein
MNILITGLTGSGKTFYCVNKMLHKEWKKGATIYSNTPLFFSEDSERVNYWKSLDELTHLKKACIFIDEAQKLMDAQRWQSLPETFKNLIRQHRHQGLDIYSNTQDLGQIDVNMRRNIHEIYNCRSMMRLPPNERIDPILQVVRITHKIRSYNEATDMIKFVPVGRARIMLISRLWSKELYDTHSLEVGFEQFAVKIEHKQDKGRKNGEWICKIYDKELIDMGKVRL